MRLARVVGNLVATAKDAALASKTILWVQPIDVDGKPLGDAYLTLDAVGAGYGETVLVVEEGGSAQQVCGVSPAPIGSAVVAVVDEVKVRS
jgi:microcompartment protein CcmK/EutM